MHINAARQTVMRAQYWSPNTFQYDTTSDGTLALQRPITNHSDSGDHLSRIFYYPVINNVLQKYFRF